MSCESHNRLEGSISLNYLCPGPITRQLGLRNFWIECPFHPGDKEKCHCNAHYHQKPKEFKQCKIHKYCMMIRA